ncbi:uncharacterized protein LOC134221507 [Armigeres subalbatus]|uniref:uncharacterized protein LOC134221507 n=1 Tax=Armigeres subalbatus TaxID=124917 RepID=UPI002ED1257A
MLGVCESCANELTEDGAVKYGGFCSTCFCQNCSKMDNIIRDNLGSNSNLFWMCNACSTMMRSARFKNVMISMNASNAQSFEELKNEIRCSVLDEIRQEIRTSFKEFIEVVPKTPAPVQTGMFSGSSKRKRDNDGKNEPTPKRMVRNQLRRGTDISAQSSAIGVQDLNRFWLYVSDISAETPDDLVTELIQQRLGSTDLKIVKLVPRGKDVRFLSFVSFKVGMPMHLKQKALTDSTWPSEISFREFEEKTNSRRVFWKPAIPSGTVTESSSPSVRSNMTSSTADQRM